MILNSDNFTTRSSRSVKDDDPQNASVKIKIASKEISKNDETIVYVGKMNKSDLVKPYLSFFNELFFFLPEIVSVACVFSAFILF